MAVADLPLGEILIAIVVPPINLLGLCLLGLVLVPRFARTGMTLLALGLCGLLLLATPFVSNRLMVALEQDLPLVPPPGNPPQAIVILSAEVVRRADAPDLDPGLLTLERERAGAALARRTGLPILVTGGETSTGTAVTTLAAVMAKSLSEDFGTPVRWIEPAATDTWENARFSAAILAAQQVRSIYLVTDAWHMRRALIAFAPTGLAVTAAPVRIDQLSPARASDVVPRTGAWMVSYYALHEWIGGLAYRWFR